MAGKPQSATSLGISPEEDRKARIIKYSVAQGVRVVCVLIAVMAGGSWVTWVAGFGAAVLPYFAVVIANAAGAGAPSKSAPKAEAPTIAIGADAFKNASSK